MSPRRVVVDGSNIATEGRSIPSLAQLDEAVRAFRDEFPTDEITVVVDATFAHRIDESERAEFEEAAAHGELVYPPAGAVGRGDAFLLRIAEKTDALVLSNDSFQEFHGEHDWLFTKGRLTGGMPVPGVGWVFVPRTPVRGPKSRESVKEAKKGKARVGSKEASLPMPVPKAPPPAAAPGKKKAAAPKAPAQKKLERAIAEATEEAVAPGDETGGRRGRRRRRGSRKSAASPTPALPTLNEPLTFITFIAEHKLGQPVEAEVESFASHGAFALVGGARCYVPLSAMGNPPPRSAREVLAKGETRTFVLQALDAPRRGIELALPGFERVSGQPTDETVEAEIAEAAEVPVKKAATRKKAAAKKTTKTTKTTAKASKATSKRPPAKRARGGRAVVDPVAGKAIPVLPEAVPEVPLLGSTVIAARRGPAVDEPAPVTAPATAAKKRTAVKKAKKAATPAKKTTATKKKKAVAAPAKKKAVATPTKTPAKKAAATAKKAKKAATPAKKIAATTKKKAVAAKKTTAVTKKSKATATTAKKKKAAAKKSS